MRAPEYATVCPRAKRFSTLLYFINFQIDGVNVIQASHEQTVQIIKKAGDVLAMKVVRAILTQDNENGNSTNALMNGSATLPQRKSQKEVGE